MSTSNGTSYANSVASNHNPTNLPPRYEIRRLTEADIPVASAIVIHSNVFHSPVWSVIYPENQVSRLHDAFIAADYLIRHQVESGLSYGVFDTEYKYNNPESAATGGKVYWDPKNTSANDSEKLLAQIDSPIASIALSYDAINPLELERLMPLFAALPLFGPFIHALDVQDARNEDDWKATGPCQLLNRNATATRADYQGKGLMKALALWLMREAKSKGFRDIHIMAFSDAVNHVWMGARSPMRSELISSYEPWTMETEGENGELIKPAEGVKQVLTKIFVHL